MISFDSFIMKDTSPIYQQIVLYIKRGVIAGTIKDSDELPSRRNLSVLLGVNPNTVQKAYKILEEENIIESHTGAKSYIILTDAKRQQIHSELTENDGITLVNAMKEMGMNKKEALALIDRLWKEED